MSGAEHQGRLSLAGKERTYTLGEDAIEWQEEGSAGRLPYTEVLDINLIAYHAARQRALQCKMSGRNGEKLYIRSLHYVGLGNFEDRTETYTPFVRDVLLKVAESAPDAKFTVGSTGLWLVWLIFAVILAGVFALMVMILFDAGGGGATTALIGMLISVIFGIPIWFGLRRGPSRPFDPLNPPQDRLGKTQG